jgi:hypothetical protein
MAIFQANTGYRDPAKSLTIKALEDRMKAAQQQAQAATQMRQPISDPTQGWAYLTNILAGGVNQAVAETRDINARDQLAQIKAGIDWNKGPTGEQYAAMGRLDPEGADKIMQDWVNYRQDMAKQQAQNQFTTSERQGTEQFTAGQETQREKAASTLAAEQAGYTSAEAQRKEQAGPGLEAAKITAETGAREAEADRLGLKPGTIERQQYVATGNMPTPIAATPQGIEAVNKFKTQGNALTSAMDNMNRAKELLSSGKVIQGAALNKILSVAADGGPTALKLAAEGLGYSMAQVRATQELRGILGLNAMTTMSNTLAGSDSDRDVQHFQSLLANESESPEVRIATINRLLSTMTKDRMTADASVRQYDPKGLGDYSYTPRGDLVAPGEEGGGGGGAAGGKKPISEMTTEEKKAEYNRLTGSAP